MSAEEPPEQERTSYKQILKSSALIGGASALNVAIGIVRTKVLAMMLAPAGFGLMSTFTTIADMARSLFEVGINSSGVRQIAAAYASGDSQKIACSVVVLRRTALVLGILGAGILAGFSREIAVFTFGSEEYHASVALLSLVLLFRIVADAQGALLQGMRRIGDIARVGAWGALLGAILSILLVYVFGEKGVAPSLVAVAGVSLIASWAYSRKVRVERPALTVRVVREEVSAMLHLGVAFMASALFTMGASYLVRLVIIRNDGLEAAGLYQAAWAVGGIYVAFILQAMGTDFYPRLVAVADDNIACNRLVNEQTHVSLLLAGTGIIATLTFAPWAITVLYSAEFAAAADNLRWICLGMAMRVVTWPLGYIMVAKGARAAFMTIDLAWMIVNVGLTWLLVQEYGLLGAGIAFFGSYVFHMMMVYPISRKLSGFRWSRTNLAVGLAFSLTIAVVQVAFWRLSTVSAVVIGCVLMVTSAIYSFCALRNVVGDVMLPRKLAWISRVKPRAS